MGRSPDAADRQHRRRGYTGRRDHALRLDLDVLRGEVDDRSIVGRESFGTVEAAGASVKSVHLERQAKESSWRVQRGRRIFTGIALIGTLGLVTGCASSSTVNGANSVEGGVKIPTAAVSTTVRSTVNVTLGDTKGLGGPMTLAVSPATAPAGDVTFVVKNTGTIDHEAIVLKTSAAFDKLPITYGGDPPVPVTTGANKVGENTNIGETGDPNLKPGVTRTFTIKNMTAGSYAIVCNLAQHYGKGMRAPFTVTGPATTVHVTLGDTKGLGGPMTLTVSPATAPAGDVTFVVKNTGTIDHEAIVLKTNTAFDKLPITYGGDPPAPVTTGANKVGEDTNIGETGDPNLKPGDTRTFTIKHMTAGEYAIVCNLAQHYGKGMRAPLTITGPNTTVNVTLGDTNGLGGPMTLTASPATAPAGDVTFVVKNTGTIDHEAVVLKTNVAFDKLPITYGGDPPAPVTTGANKVGEDTNIGETGDPNLKPGDTRTFTIKNMTAGNYAIVCNLAQHYGKGMRAPLTVR